MRLTVAFFLAAAALSGCRATSDLAAESYAGPTSLPEIRAAHSLPPLTRDPNLEAAARQQASFMAETGRMEHTTGIGRSFARRMRGNGIEGAAAENIAHGAFGSDELFRRWMNSPPHRANMLSASYTRFGLASAKEPGGNRRYWALVLAK